MQDRREHCRRLRIHQSRQTCKWHYQCHTSRRRCRPLLSNRLGPRRHNPLTSYSAKLRRPVGRLQPPRHPLLGEHRFGSPRKSRISRPPLHSSTGSSLELPCFLSCEANPLRHVSAEYDQFTSAVPFEYIYWIRLKNSPISTIFRIPHGIVGERLLDVGRFDGTRAPDPSGLNTVVGPPESRSLRGRDEQML